MENGNGIYDFQAEMWQYYKEYEREGETDAWRDKKAFDEAKSNTKFD